MSVQQILTRPLLYVYVRSVRIHAQFTAPANMDDTEFFAISCEMSSAGVGSLECSCVFCVYAMWPHSYSPYIVDNCCCECVRVCVPMSVRYPYLLMLYMITLQAIAIHSNVVGHIFCCSILTRVMQKFIIHDIRQIDPAILSICDGHLVEQAFLRLLRALFSQFGIGFAAY